MHIEIIKPYGFCFGVDKSLNELQKIIDANPLTPIYLLGEPIHNKEVLEKYLTSNVFLISENYKELKNFVLKQTENNSIYILSAHGHYKDLEEILENKKFKFYDLTCPIIKHIHQKLSEIPENKDVIYIGNKNHTEAETSFLYIKSKNKEIFSSINENQITNNTIITNQSTHSIDEYKNIHDNNTILDNFCPSLKYRYQEYKLKAINFNLIIVVGASNSSNANFLLNFIQEITDTILINDKNHCLQNIDKIKNYSKIGIVSATSTSKELVDEIYEFLINYFLK